MNSGERLGPQGQQTSEHAEHPVNSPHQKLEAKLLARLEARSRKPRITSVGAAETPRDPWREAANMIAGASNQLNDLYQIWYDPDIPQIFPDQEAFDTFYEQGFTALSDEQAATAFTVLDATDDAEAIYRDFISENTKRIEQARENNDLSSYLMWKMQQSNLYYHRREEMVGQAILDRIHDRPAKDLKSYVADVEEGRKKFEAEAKLATRMAGIMNEIPDTGDVRVVITRVPAEVDRSRPERALSHFPAGTINRWNNDPEKAVPQASLEYCITTAPCIQNSFDNLYKVTRREKPKRKGRQNAPVEFEPRAFYVTSQVAEVDIDDPSVSPAARRFLEVSFADGTAPLPSIRADMPKVAFRKAPVILRMEDCVRNLVITNDQLHYKLGVDENGNEITQDMIPYAMDTLLGGTSNAYTIPVQDFFPHLLAA